MQDKVKSNWPNQESVHITQLGVSHAAGDTLRGFAYYRQVLIAAMVLEEPEIQVYIPPVGVVGCSLQPMSYQFKSFPADL